MKMVKIRLLSGSENRCIDMKKERAKQKKY